MYAGLKRVCVQHAKSRQQKKERKKSAQSQPMKSNTKKSETQKELPQKYDGRKSIQTNAKNDFSVDILKLFFFKKFFEYFINNFFSFDLVLCRAEVYGTFPQ